MNDAAILPGTFFQAADMLSGYSYGHNVHYPEPLPGLDVRIAPPREIDCCTAVEAIVLGAARRSGLTVEWGIERHRVAVCAPPGERWPTRAYVAAGLAAGEASEGVPTSWSVLQVWGVTSDGRPRGHTMLVVDSDEARGLILEANRPRLGHGGGLVWRELGPYQPGIGPPRDWQTRGVRWATLRARYPEWRWAPLRVAG